MGLNFYLGEADEKISYSQKEGHIGKRSGGWLFSINLCSMLKYALEHQTDKITLKQGRIFEDLVKIIENAGSIFSDRPLSRDLLPLVIKHPWIVAQPIQRSQKHANTYILQIPAYIISEQDIFDIIRRAETCHDENDESMDADSVIAEIKDCSQVTETRYLTNVSNVDKQMGADSLQYHIGMHKETHSVQFRVGGSLMVSRNAHFS